MKPLPFLLPAFLFLLCTCGRGICIAQSAIPTSESGSRDRAQEMLPEAFTTRATAMNVELDSLLKLGFQIREPKENPFLDDHLVLYSKSEKLEMRFHLRPARSNDPMADMPHLRAHTVAMNLGSNDENAVTTVHSFDDEELAALNADWMRMYTFRPKTSYSDRAHAQLVAVYRKGRGIVYILLLFDKTTAPLDDRQLSARFK